ncbi:hypothetical protein JYT79_01955 [Cardiobacterium sp. AH-315-I02]|nr:hypothetical protein [Cardiobacterium sp. AH-315-I02]
MKNVTILSLALIPLISSCAFQQVSYQNDVIPIINNKCVECHAPPNGNGYRATGLVMDSYDALMQGSVYGPIIVAGDSKRSVLNMLVEGRAGNVQKSLHNSGNALTDDEIQLFRAWVEQGALDN